MIRLKRTIYNIIKWALYLAISSAPGHGDERPAAPDPALEEAAPFVKLAQSGRPLATPADTTVQWRCVLDRRTRLIWEVKTSVETDDSQLQDTQYTYSWFWPDRRNNGGHAGYPDKGRCSLPRCNTRDYVSAINDIKLCGSSEWRLPTREELRTLVDYTVSYPGPTIDQRFFPHTQSQFYWSSNTDASNIDSAWGIGFSFGFDYAYFKSDMGFVRLVHGPVP